MGLSDVGDGLTSAPHPSPRSSLPSHRKEHLLDYKCTIMRDSRVARLVASLAAAALLSLGVTSAVAAPPEILVYYAVCRIFPSSRPSTDAAMPRRRIARNIVGSTSLTMPQTDRRVLPRLYTGCNRCTAEHRPDDFTLQCDVLEGRKSLHGRAVAKLLGHRLPQQFGSGPYRLGRGGTAAVAHSGRKSCGFACGNRLPF